MSSSIPSRPPSPSTPPSSSEVASHGSSADASMPSSEVESWNGHEVTVSSEESRTNFTSIARNQSAPQGAASAVLTDSAYSSQESLASLMPGFSHQEQNLRHALESVNLLLAQQAQMEQEHEEALNQLGEVREQLEADPENTSLQQALTQAETRYQELTQNLATLNESLNNGWDHLNNRTNEMGFVRTPVILGDPIILSRAGSYIVNNEGDYQEEYSTVASGSPVSTRALSQEGTPFQIAVVAEPVIEVHEPAVIAPASNRSIFSFLRRSPYASPSPEVTARLSPFPQASARFVSTPTPQSSGSGTSEGSSPTPENPTPEPLG